MKESKLTPEQLNQLSERLQDANLYEAAKNANLYSVVGRVVFDFIDDLLDTQSRTVTAATFNGPDGAIPLEATYGPDPVVAPKGYSVVAFRPAEVGEIVVCPCQGTSCSGVYTFQPGDHSLSPEFRLPHLILERVQ